MEAEGKRKTDFFALLILLLGAAARLLYVLHTTVYERGHDVGNYTILTDGIVNPGHLGYIEYLAKFRHLPDFDPYTLFSYYHPPLHHFLSSLVVRASVFFGASVDTAFENVQLLTLFYSVLAMVLAYRILCMFSEGRFVLVPFALFCFHPSTVYMAGSVNNDMLTVTVELWILYLGLQWIAARHFRTLCLLALAFGLGMLVKISVIVLAVPVGIAMGRYLVKAAVEGASEADTRQEATDGSECCGRDGFISQGNVMSVGRVLRQYLVFVLIAGGIGCLWIVRNLVLFHEKPGISSATPESFLYMGNYSLLRRLGPPTSFGLSYPFHSIYGSASDNVWLILFRTAVFGEIRPDVSGVSLFLCQILFLLNLALGLFCTGLLVWCCVRAMRGGRVVVDQAAVDGEERSEAEHRVVAPTGDRERGIYLLSGYLAFLFSYIAFVIKYPYTCSCDFRYIVPTLLYGCIALAWGG